MPAQKLDGSLSSYIERFLRAGRDERFAKCETCADVGRVVLEFCLSIGFFSSLVKVWCVGQASVAALA